MVNLQIKETHDKSCAFMRRSKYLYLMCWGPETSAISHFRGSHHFLLGGHPLFYAIKYLESIKTFTIKEVSFYDRLGTHGKPYRVNGTVKILPERTYTNSLTAT